MYMTNAVIEWSDASPETSTHVLGPRPTPTHQENMFDSAKNILYIHAQNKHNISQAAWILPLSAHVKATTPP